MEKGNPIEEARRYVDNAKQTLNANGEYDTMHIAMSYDGNQSKAVCDEGFRLADEIIKICSKMLPKQQNPEI